MEDREYGVHITPKEGTEAMRIIHEPIETRKLHQWNTRDYALESMTAVIDLIQSKGNPDKTVVFYNSRQVQVILDDSVQDRPLDTVAYDYKISDQLMNWKSTFGVRLSQKTMADFLRRLDPDELPDKDVLVANIRKLQVITEIKGDYEYDEAGNVSVMYKESNGTEGVMALPRSIFPLVRILNESDYEASIEVEIELIKPKSEDEKPTIILQCPKFELYVRDAIAYEMDRLKQALNGYLILAGSW